MNRKTLALAVVKDAIGASQGHEKSKSQNEEERAIVSTEEMTEKARWIRDVLEPGIAVYGPSHLSPDVTLTLYTFLENLLVLTNSDALTFNTLQTSRIHLALLLIIGRGTRWPSQLIDVTDKVVEAWTERFGKLALIRPVLFGRGGRLEGMGSGLEGDDAVGERSTLLVRWLSDPETLVSPLRALEHGHLEFSPGQWWINQFYAFHDGIIDTPDPHGGITSDSDGAYAIMLTDHDEVSPFEASKKIKTYDQSPTTFTYRCRSDDMGRYRLINAILPPHPPVRVLRSHTLHSLWAPIAGVRYDGLYRVIKYSMKAIRGELVFDVTLQRRQDQPSMMEVYQHPTAAEVDDYIEYKRMRDSKRAKKRKAEQEQSLAQILKEPPEETYDIAKAKGIEETIENGVGIYITDEDEDEETARRVMQRKSAIDHGLQRRASADTAYDRSESPFGSPLDGTCSTETLPRCSSPEAHRHSSQPDILRRSLTRQISSSIQSDLRAKLQKSIKSGSVRYCGSSSVGSEASSPRKLRFSLEGESRSFDDGVKEERRKDSAYASNRGSASLVGYTPDLIGVRESHFDEVFPQSLPKEDEISTKCEEVTIDSEHVKLNMLANHMQELSDAFTRRGFVSTAVIKDLRDVQDMLAAWKESSMEEHGEVDWCLMRVEGIVAEICAWSCESRA